MKDQPKGQPVTLTVKMALDRHPAVGRNRIYDAMHNGVLPAVKVGKRYALAIRSVDEWVASGCPTSRGRNG